MEDLFEMNDIEIKNGETIRLKKVEIENYRSIEKDEFEIGEKGIVFTGENGVGKTTRIEAILWTLTDTLFDNSTQGLTELIIPIGSEQGTEAKVQLTFDNFGEEIVLTKTIKEKWVKKRGTDEIVLEGSQTHYFYNGVERDTKKDYYKLVYRLFGLEDAITKIERETKLLSKVNFMNLFTNLEYFKTLDNKTLRELILLVGGNVEITSLEMSETLKGLLSKKNNDLDELKKAVKQNLKQTKKDVDGKKVEVETHKKSLTGIPTEDELAIAKSTMMSLDDEISDLRLEMKKTSQELTKDLESEKLKIEFELEQQRNKEIEIKGDPELREEILTLEDDIKTMEEYNPKLEEAHTLIKEKLSAVTQTIGSKQAEIIKFKKQGQQIIIDRDKLKNEDEWELAVCECCGQKIGKENIQKHIDAKNEQLKELANEIKGVEISIGKLTDEQTEKQSELESSTKGLEKRASRLIELRDELSNLRKRYDESLKIATRDDFTSKEVLSIMERLNAVKSQISDASTNGIILEKTNNAKLDTLNRERETQQEIVNSATMGKTFRTNLETTQDELKELTKRLTTLEQVETEIKILEESYLRLIDEKVSSAFGENIKFKLFDTNLSNENITPTCDMFVRDGNGRWVNAINGVNTGHSVPRLLEFLNLVRQSLEIKNSFVLIDFFESIGSQPLNQMLAQGTQIIATQVVRNQNELKVEVL